MSLREQRAALRGATYRGDGSGVVQLLMSTSWPDDVLQLVGDAVLVALRTGADGVQEPAGRCVTRLRSRAWEGDDELADELEARSAVGPQPMLRPVPGDLDELAMVLEGDPVHGGGRVDLRSGQVWPQPVVDDFEDGDIDDEDADYWLAVESQGSRSGYRDMGLFMGTVKDPRLAELLTTAIAGQGAFRRFKNALSGHPEVADRWYAFSDDRARGRARSWLASKGYTPRPTLPE